MEKCPLRVPLTGLRLADDGALLHPGAALEIVPILNDVVGHLPRLRPGHRLTDMTALASFLAPDSTIGRLAGEALGRTARPVRAVLFDKTPGMNWPLGWHQDRTIVVAARRDVPGFHAWTIKQGRQHVVPPFAILAAMVTLRVHLDDVPATNAPLLIAAGSHRVGVVSVPDVAAVVRRHVTYACTAQAGDIWVYSTPILHASDKASVPGRRRVLQVDYSADHLPGGLEWLGIGDV